MGIMEKNMATAIEGCCQMLFGSASPRDGYLSPFGSSMRKFPAWCVLFETSQSNGHHRFKPRIMGSDSFQGGFHLDSHRFMGDKSCDSRRRFEEHCRHLKSCVRSRSIMDLKEPCLTGNRCVAFTGTEGLCTRTGFYFN